MTWYERIPKIELHVHLEGAIPHGALFELIQKYGGDPSVPSESALKKLFAYTDFAHFIKMWSWKNQFLRELEDFTHISEAVARKMARQNILYAEIFFSPSIFSRHHHLDMQKLTEAIRVGFSKVPEIKIAMIADLVRDYGPESEMSILEQLAEIKNLGVVGIGIGGSEHQFPAKPFTPLFRAARRLGFRTNAHAGESSGPASVWSAIEDLQADRIGHATRAIEDAALVDYIVEHKIPVELCPISNVRTGVVSSIPEHPIREYLNRGMVISVNTDDPEMFETSLAKEYRVLEKEAGFSRQELCHMIDLALESSWLKEEEKKSIKSRLHRLI